MLEFIEPDNEWLWRGGYETRAVPKAAGFRWDAKHKVWWTSDKAKAARLASHAANDETKASLAGVESSSREEVEASRAEDATLPADLGLPDGLDLLPFQRAGVAYALGRRGTLIADEMGLGKTVQALAVIAATGAKDVLVVCPASLRLNWRNEAVKWLANRPGVSVGVVDKSNWPDDASMVIVNYDVLQRHAERIKQRAWDILICDECHYLKNPGAKRTRQVLGHWDRKKKRLAIEPIKADRRIFLTGTPIVNRPVELHPVVASLCPQEFGNYYLFVKRYCAAKTTRFGFDVSGASNLAELQSRLRASVMVRRLKADVMPDLPLKQRQVIELPTNGAASAVKTEAAAWEAREDLLHDLRLAVELAKASESSEEYAEAVSNLRAAEQHSFEELAKARMDVAVAKVPYVIEHLEAALEGGPVVCFAHHHAVIDLLSTHFGEQCVTLTGKTSLDQRQEAVERFQAGEVKLFIGGIQAAGVGITLTRSSHVVFAELDWVPAAMTQAEDRCHRIGATADRVLVQHLVLEGSLDARMARVVVAKQAVIDKALDSGSLDTAAQAEQPAVPENGKAASATTGTGRDKVIRIAAEITDEQVAAVHEALRSLAGFCDGARGLDDMGFSKIDVRIGHELAESETLTKRQAALGAIVANKYRKRQLPEGLAAVVHAAATI